VSGVVPEQAIRSVAKRNEEIEIAVVVVIDPHSLTCHAGEGQPERRRDVGEMPAVSIVAVQLVGRRACESHEQVDIAVPVEVAPRGDARLDVVGDADLCRHIAKASVILLVEAIRPAAKADELVELPVVVEIGPGVRLAARRGEEVLLHELEIRARVLSVGDAFASDDRDAHHDRGDESRSHGRTTGAWDTYAAIATMSSEVRLATTSFISCADGPFRAPWRMSNNCRAM
jgi:hypothetical protein